jgi:hypothetical protein
MMTNVGMIDRALRLAAGLALILWTAGYFGPGLDGLSAWFAGVFGAYPAITGVLRYCPLLALAGISTCSDEI